MNLLLALAFISTPTVIDTSLTVLKNDAYCQNIYFHPNSEELMKANDCDVEAVALEIYKVKTGRY